MKYLSSAELRAAFLSFFAAKEHRIVPSSSLIPHNDATLLFTNAGMVQFKDLFLGREQRDYVRAASSQRCVRAGGKHNDLENVGYTARHHTFFEMLGNFSFGDYFKREAIHYAWEFLTQELAIPADRLWITVYEQDDEAAQIWLDEIGIDRGRFSRIGTKDNFWSMGDVGPCGPCSEIFYDHGAHIPGGPPGSPDEEGDRYIEIWNLVFMQYDRAANGELIPLPKPSVDTGMGLERIAAVVQGVHSNYDIDLFRHLLQAAAALAGRQETHDSSLRVLADHIRSCAFLIADGVLPSNEGRGYVLRRIIRRAIRHGYRLGIRDVFFHKLVAPLVATMGDAYPELTRAQAHVEQVLHKEEERFAETLEQGMRILESCIDRFENGLIPGDTVFLLYDTYGFPVDLTADFAREHGLHIDQAGFDTAMQQQRERARAASQFGADYGSALKLDVQCQFIGYDTVSQTAQIIALYQDGQAVTRLSSGAPGLIVLDQTPFYAESGGQAGDRGEIVTSHGVFLVTDTQKQGEGAIVHHGQVAKGEIHAGSCEARVDLLKRRATARNHSATHLLHAALRRILGEHVTQKGSLVNAERLRFDFSHFEPVNPEQLHAIEELVNEQIRDNAAVSAEIMDKDAALQAGAMALFGEKYGERVRVLKIGEFSTELCGGTHVTRAGDIGAFKIITETGVASGVRRIEAITGAAVVVWMQERERLLNELAQVLKAAPDSVLPKVQQLLDKNRALEKEFDKLRGQMASAAGDELLRQAVAINGVQVLAVQVDGADAKALRDLADQLKNKLGRAALVLASIQGDKINLIASVSKEVTSQIKAGDLVNFVATQVGGKGGGRPDMAQAGGNDPSALPGALQQVPDWIAERLH